MDSVRCPMCGKPNPPDTVICQFCQARLEPLIAPTQPEEGQEEDKGSEIEGDSLPGWLDGLRSSNEAEQELEIDEAQEEDATDWTLEEEGRLSNAFSSSSESDEEQEQDWLSRLVSDQEEISDQPTEESAASTAQASSAFFSMDELLGEEGSSDWLADFETSSLGLEDPEEQSEEGFEPADAEQGEKPGWLEKIRAKQEKESEQEQGSAPPGEGGIEQEEPGSEETSEQPDWLSDIGIDEDREDFTIDSKDLPEWLTGVEPFELEAESSELEVEPTGEGSIRGWLTESELAQEKPEMQQGEDLPDWLEEETETPASTEQAPQQELPEWMVGIDKTGLPEPVESEAEQPPVESEESGLPDWLTRLDASGTYQPAEEESPALILDDVQQVEESGAAAVERPVEEEDISAVPDWLSQFSSSEEQAEAPAPLEDELEPDLAEAQLPSWLQAMRPVESAAPSTTGEQEQDVKVEQVGPLAGLSGVLAAEPEFIHIRKPRSSLVKLQVSDNQQSHVTLLENLLAEEGQPKPVSERSTITSQYFLRLIIALAVLVSVIVPLWLNRQILPMPDPSGVSNEVYDFGRLVAGLPGSAAVLVAFDYEPGFSGEMDASAAPVLAEMADRGIHLALVSTKATGPLLAERFTNTHLQDTGSRYNNLGFVPGGAGGLLAFAQSPRSVIPFDLQGARVWELAPLSSISSLSDFGAVFVLTDNPETARAWIEQVQPFLGPANKPLLMVLSAQAEPMVRPYYETDPRQVSGMISGLAGMAAFESVSGQSGLTRLYWDAYGSGLVVAVGLILVGALVSLVLALLAQPGKKEVEATL
jgi:hypothetical protein